MTQKQSKALFNGLVNMEVFCYTEFKVFLEDS